MKIVSVVGARPNFVKIAPFLGEMRKHADMCSLLVNTGQHYDANMADQFFQELQIPRPDVSLDVGSGSHACQTAEVMRGLEPILERSRPDAVVVVGDVNSTLACSIVATARSPQTRKRVAELGLADQVLAAGEDRPAPVVPQRQQLGLLVRALLLAGALERLGSIECASVSRAIRSRRRVAEISFEEVRTSVA